MNVRMFEGENEKAARRERVKPRYDSGTGLEGSNVGKKSYYELSLRGDRCGGIGHEGWFERRWGS